MIVLMAGLPGSGKSTLAQGLANRTRGAILNKDAVRAAIFAAGDTEYSIEQDDFVMEIMLQCARFLFDRSPARVVFLDGRTFSKTYQIERVLRFANEIEQPWNIIECACSIGSARRRLRKIDHGEEHPAKNRSFDMYSAVKDGFQEITHTKIVIDTDRPLEECISQALLFLAPDTAT